jgi:hypothetical protein
VLWKNSNFAIFYAGLSNKEPRIAIKIAWIRGSKAKMAVFGGNFAFGMPALGLLGAQPGTFTRKPALPSLLHMK